MANVNPYAPPQVSLEPRYSGENTSGLGKGHPVPEGVKGWSWGAFLLNWIWAIGNKSYIGLLCFVPYLGTVVAIWLGIKGRELAWQNKRWDSLEHFNQVQRRWSMWALILVGGMLVLGVFGGIAAYGVSKYVENAKAAKSAAP